MAGLEPDMAMTESSCDELSRDTKRGLLSGCVAGAATGVLLMACWGLPGDLAHLWHALRQGRFAEFGSDLALAAFFAVQFLAIGLLAAMPTAFPFMIAMTRCEERYPLMQKAWVWATAGALFAIPSAVWFMAEFASYESDGPGRWNLTPLYFNMACGMVGGFAAWRGYFRRVR